jgi:hypothetical protein
MVPGAFACHCALTPRVNTHKAQILNYLVVTGLRLELLINFCSYPKAES